MKSKVEKINLFPVKICKTKCQNHEKIKKFMMDFVYDHFCKHGPNNDFGDVYTDYIPGAVQINWMHLYNLYRPSILNLLESIGIEDIYRWQINMKGWYNFTTSTDQIFFHDHVGGPSTIQFAVVHYVNLNETSEGTVFQNPYFDKLRSVIPTKNINLTPEYFLNSLQTPSVEEGDIILFPSWLLHSFPIHSNGSLRVTNALNIMLRVDNSDGM